MKKKMMALVVGLLTCASSQASVKDLVGSWNGIGTTYSLNGENEGTYALEMTDFLQSDGSVASTVDIAIPNLPNKEIDLVLKDTPKGFSMISGSTSGGATCLEKGLCEGYIGDANGNGMAITFIIDGANSFKLLKTELQGFKATRLFLEKYVRSQAK